MKYFCISEATAFYLQKYIVYRKRKILDDMTKILLKHKTENFLVPLSDIHKENIPGLLDQLNLKYTKAILYKTVSSDLSDIKNLKEYDIIAFYTPSGIKSLFQNFPDFVQDTTVIAAFGPATAVAVEEAGLRLDIKAPTPQCPSMTMAIEEFIKRYNKENSRYSKKLPTDKHPNILIIAQCKINFNRFSENKIINIFNKSVDIVEN